MATNAKPAPTARHGASEFGLSGEATGSGVVQAANQFRPIVVCEWRRNSRENVRITLDVFQGCPIVDIRTHFAADDGTRRPTRTGISLSLERHLEPLAAALAEALSRAHQLGLLPDGEVGS